MRPALLREVAEKVEALRDADGDTRLARQLLVDTFGPQCAAWLVRKHRAQFHRAGALDVVVPKGVEPKPWFEIAVEFLRARKDWSVDVSTHRGERVYRFRWHAHLRRAPESALRRIGT